MIEVFSAIAPLVGAALIGGAASLIGGASANKANAKEASRSRQFTERQLKNRHQWEVQDLRKANLNPILSAGGTPSIGGSAQAVHKNIASGAASDISQAAAAGVSSEQTDLIKEKQKTEKTQQTKNQADALSAMASATANSTKAQQMIVDTAIKELDLKTLSENPHLQQARHSKNLLPAGLGPAAQITVDSAKGLTDDVKNIGRNLTKEAFRKSIPNPKRTIIGDRYPER